MDGWKECGCVHPSPFIEQATYTSPWLLFQDVPQTHGLQQGAAPCPFSCSVNLSLSHRLPPTCPHPASCSPAQCSSHPVQSVPSIFSSRTRVHLTAPVSAREYLTDSSQIFRPARLRKFQPTGLQALQRPACEDFNLPVCTHFHLHFRLHFRLCFFRRSVSPLDRDPVGPGATRLGEQVPPAGRREGRAHGRQPAGDRRPRRHLRYALLAFAECGGVCGERWECVGVCAAS
jgi:hypothetical protein